MFNFIITNLYLNLFQIWNKIILIVCLVCFALPLNGIGSLTIRFSYLIQRDEKNESIVSIDVVETKQVDFI